MKQVQMDSKISFTIESDTLTETITLALAMIDKTHVDPKEILLDDLKLKWNRADAVALVSGSITEQQYIELNRIDQK